MRTTITGFGFGLCAALVTMGISACGGSSHDGGQTLTLRGNVDTTTQALGPDARVAAITTNGASYWSRIDGSGRFAVTVPTAHAYRLVVANGQHVTGHLVVGSTVWIGVHQTGTWNLGALSTTMATTGTQPAAGSLAAASESADDTDVSGGANDDSAGSDAEKEDSTHETDDDASKLCSDGDKELHADNAPANEFSDDGVDDDAGKEKEGSEPAACSGAPSQP